VSEVRIAAEPRTEFGKGGARRTRRAGKVPAVLYGHGTPPRHICLPAREFAHALKTEGGANVLLELAIDGGRELALPKAIQRDPLRGDIEHVDLILVRRGEKVTVEVAVVTQGQIEADGLLDVQLSTLSVEAEATHIPQHIEVDIDGLTVGASIHAGDIPLPDGILLQTDPEAVVVHVLAAPSAAQIEAEIAGAEAELGAGPAAPAAVEAAAAAAGDQPPTGEGDVVADTASGEGGPAEGQGA
jgi:large subunit ribosomal protein L25